MDANLKRLDWSQAELSRRLGMKDPSYISNSMRGVRKFTAEEIATIENLFGESFKAPASLNFSFEKSDENVPNLVLEQLRAVRADNEKTHRILFDILQRLGSLEQKVGIIVQDIARVDARLDAFDMRKNGIGRRLEPSDA